MAETTKETVILDFQIEQGDAIAELERTKKVILDLKKEQDALNKAYKAGTITQEEYVSELVRVESVMKKTQATYNTTQKSVTGVKTSMDKLIESNKQLASNVNIAGVNVGQLGQRLTQLATPVGLAVGVVTALGAAYARSANGAEDLEFASTRLSAAFGLLSNDVAKLMGASDKDGEGSLNRMLDFFLKVNPLIGTLDRIGLTNIAEDSERIALAGQKLDDLLREEIAIRATVSDRLADNQEKMTIISESQTDINEKAHLAGEIIDNLRLNETELLAVKKKQTEELEEQKKSATDVKAIDTRILEIAREESNIKKDTQRKVEAINRLTSNLSDAERKRLETIERQNAALEFQRSEAEREKRIRDLDESLQQGSNDDPFGLEGVKNQEIKLDDERIKRFHDNTKKTEDELKARGVAYRAYVQEQISLTEDNFLALAGLFSQGSEARRLFALAAIGADTAQAISSLTAMSEANPANAVTFGGAGVAQYAAGIIRILANIVAAKEFLTGGEFAGGGDFITTKPTMIMVGDNPGGRERVTVEPLSGKGQTTYNPRSGLMAMAGGGSLTFDGAKELAVQSVQQNLALVNSIKRMPRPVVSWTEGRAVGQRVEFKEKVSKL